MEIKKAPRQGDIILMDFNPSLGHEQKGYRPGLIINHPLLSKTSPFVWIVPISSGNYQHPSHVKLDNRTKTQGTIFIEQLGTYDYQFRNLKIVEKIPDDLLKTVLNKTSNLLTITD